MKHSKATVLFLLSVGCGGPPFTLSDAPDTFNLPDALPGSGEDAGPDGNPKVEAQAREAGTPESEAGDAGSAEEAGEAGREASADAKVAPKAEAGAEVDASPPEASPETSSEASPPDSPPPPSTSFKCVSPGTGYVQCLSGGGWTVSFTTPQGGMATCDDSHPAMVGCPVGAACSFYQSGGMHYAGTCQ